MKYGKKGPDLIYAFALKRVYRLSNAWIRRLGPPDRFVAGNPRRHSHGVGVYDRARIEVYLEEHHEEYLALLLAQAERSRQEGAQECQRAAMLTQWAETVEILVIAPLPVEMSRLRREAERVFLASCTPAEKIRGFKFTKRAVVAHVRHHYTNYHALLLKFDRAKQSSTAAYLILRNRVNRLVTRLVAQQYGSEIEALDSS